MKYLYLFILSAGWLSANAQTPVWSTDVAPVIYNRCASCHRNNGIAPFTLLSYNDAIAHASTIKSVVQDGTMPPWPPDPAYKHLAHERVLSPAEKTSILNWLNGGRPRGDISLEPPAPTFSNTGDLPGTPDLVLRIPAYTSNAALGDVYRCFVLPTGLSADKFMTAFECLPGNRPMVHHVLVYADTTGTSTTLDAADPGPGYTSFGGIGVSSAVLLGTWVPGSVPMSFPNGFGMRLSKNAKLVLQIHYPAGTSGMKDSTEVHLFFSPTNSVRNLSIAPVLNHEANINAPLDIAANSIQEYTESQFVPLDATLFGLLPHMHLIGTQIKSYVVTPTGDTQRGISIPKWDFHWQGLYMLRQAMKVSAGSTVYANATYDNTTGNPFNPSNPPVRVKAGEATTDEMMVVYVLYSNYQPGDENIVIDTTRLLDVRTPGNYYNGITMLQPYPVPADKQLVVKFHLDIPGTGSVALVDMNGRVVLQAFSDKKLPAGYTALPVGVGSIPAGLYTVRLSVDGQQRSCLIRLQH